MCEVALWYLSLQAHLQDLIWVQQTFEYRSSWGPFGNYRTLSSKIEVFISAFTMSLLDIGWKGGWMDGRKILLRRFMFCLQNKNKKTKEMTSKLALAWILVVFQSPSLFSFFMSSQIGHHKTLRFLKRYYHVSKENIITNKLWPYIVYFPKENQGSPNLHKFNAWSLPLFSTDIYPFILESSTCPPQLLFWRPNVYTYSKLCVYVPMLLGHVTLHPILGLDCDNAKKNSN